MAEAVWLSVEIAYADAAGQVSLAVRVAPGTTVAQAIAVSGLLTLRPQIDLLQQKFGIYGKCCGSDTPVVAGDRIEIYRPLQTNPMEGRRRRAKIARLRVLNPTQSR